jgi:hypothetical protein
VAAGEVTLADGRSGHSRSTIALVAIALVAIVVPLALVGMVVVARTGSISLAAAPSSTSGTTVPAMPSTVAAASTAPSTSESTIPAVPAPVPAVPAAAPAPAPVIVGASATSMRAPGADACGNATTYEPAKAVDGQPSTAWMVVGDGVGQTITLQLASPSAVCRVGLVAGYDKVDPCTGLDRFNEVRRITAVRWTFDDGRQVDQLFNGSRRLQEIDLGADVVTSTVRITVLSTTPHGGRDMTAVSELAIR